MARWMLKAAVQGVISLLPGSRSLNYLLQKYITGSLNLDEARFRVKLLCAKRHLENCFRAQVKQANRFNVLELGTGWYPVIPIAFYLVGASKIWTIDKQSLLRPSNVRRTLGLFVDFIQREDLPAIFPCVDRDRIGALLSANDDGSRSVAQMLAKLNIEVLVRDARHTGLEQGSVDFFLSNSVLQEIPEDILSAIFAEFRRLSSPVGTMSHYVNMVEPYADFDRAVTAYHFLRYSDPTWKLLNNSLHYHNRLRIADYRKIHESAGFRTLQEDNERGSTEDLDKVRLAKKFRRYSHDDLLITRSWIVSTCHGREQIGVLASLT